MVPSLHPEPAPPPLAALAARPALRLRNTAATLWRARRNLLHMFHPEAGRLPWHVASLAGARLVTVGDPALARHVLGEPGTFRKGPLYEALLGDVLGSQGSLLLEGEASRARRRLLAPAFNARAVARLEGLAARRVAAALDGWAGAGEIDAGAECARLTMGIALEAFFSADLGPALEAVAARLDRLIVTASQPSLADLLALPAWAPRRSRAAVRRDVAALDATLVPLIEARLGRPAPPEPDLLDALVHARDPETGAGLSPAALRDEVMTLFLAGHETTGLAMAWGLDRLAREPAAQERLAADPGWATLAFEETLRLFPPAYALARQAARADERAGVAFRPGDRIQIPVFMLHRNPRFWDRPDAYDPDRFAAPAPAAFMPFGWGPRQCVGIALARMEGRMLLAEAARRFVLAPLAEPPRAVGRVTLRPATPIRLRIAERRGRS